MTTKANEASAPAPRGEYALALSSQPDPSENQGSRNSNAVLKSGPLFISSKGIGWTSWKKRWFILTHKSLVFFRSDPNAALLRNDEVNLTLGGIDLNNSGSVEVKPEKKLLTVLFHDGRDGRAFTLKAETMDDLYEWKTALESALTLAPSAAAPTGKNGILRNDQGEAVNGLSDQRKDKLPVKSMVIGRPILLALEDIDGSPSFLEKALTFIEDHGVNTEGILRQAADVEEVERRVREYEQGKTEFSSNEDAHVIADCIKYVLRELPSSPVPASCCNALLEAFRSDRNNRVNAMRHAVLESFPEPNRCLLQRILIMMKAVASHKDENRMSVSAVAACMSPLLLRPLLAGECEVESEILDVGGDGSFQLLQAAAAANHAQAIIITLLEEYDYIFGRGSVSPELFSDTEESVSESEEETDDDEDNDEECGSEEYEEGTDEEYEHSVSETCSDDGASADYNDNVDDHDDSADYNEDKHSGGSSPVSKSAEKDNNHESVLRSTSASSQISRADQDHVRNTDDKLQEHNNHAEAKVDHAGEIQREIPEEASIRKESFVQSPSSTIQISAATLFGCTQSVRCPRWGRTSANQNLSMESIDFSLDDEDEIKRLEVVKNDLQNQIEEEASGNVILQASLEKRKEALHERRLALEREMKRLQEQLQREKELRTTIEAELEVTGGFFSGNIDQKQTKTELEEIALIEEHLSSLKQRVDDLGAQVNQQREPNYSLLHDRNNQPQEAPTQGTVLRRKQKDHDMNSSSRFEKSTRNKVQSNDSFNGTDHDGEGKYEGSSSLNISQNEKVDVLHVSSSKSTGPSSGSTAMDAADPRCTPSASSKKPSSKGEVINSTTSALSKLSGRLNFLKERHTQIACELQDTDQSVGGGLDQSHGGNKKAYVGKSESLSIHSLDVGRKPEVQSTQHFDRIKSESQSARNGDKGLRSEGKNQYKRFGL